ncbi:MAG: OsmC family protein [Gemmatimonadales bacterium]
MNPVERIKTAIGRGIQAMELRPTLGRGTAVTRARLRGGLACEVSDGRWRLAADMSDRHGGKGTGPDPGVFGRAALASCLTIGYAMWAARMGVVLESLEVSVEADYDARGQYGLSEDPPSYAEVRCKVAVSSPSPRAEVERMIETANRYSPYLDLFRRPMPVTTELELTTTAG